MSTASALHLSFYISSLSSTFSACDMIKKKKFPNQSAAKHQYPTFLPLLDCNNGLLPFHSALLQTCILRPHKPECKVDILTFSSCFVSTDFFKLIQHIMEAKYTPRRKAGTCILMEAK